MSAIDIVSRLEHCRQVREGEWLARCPAHDDKSPSLSIKDDGDCRTLIHCFAGCGAVDVLASIGLELQDLYPPTDRNYHAERKHYDKSVDELVVEIAMSDMRSGKSIDAADRDRVRAALVRIDSGDPSPNVDKSQIEHNALMVAEKEAQRTAERLAILRGQGDEVV